MSTCLTAVEWEAVRTALSFLLAGETDDFDRAEVVAAESALSKLQDRGCPKTRGDSSG